MYLGKVSVKRYGVFRHGPEIINACLSGMITYSSFQ